MTMLVTLAQARAHVRSDDTADDDDLTLKIHAASGAVLNYVRNGADIFTDSAGDPVLDSNGVPIGIPFEVKAATLLLIGDFYSHRETGELKWDHGYLPPAVIALLYPYRDPSLA